MAALRVRSVPGNAGGGCAFRGARFALLPIADAAHVVHGPITCQGHSWETRPTASSGSQLHRLAFTTDISELDVVCGSEGKLRRAIAALVARHRPPAVFVYQTCLPAVMGDDVSAICREASLCHGIAVLPVLARGFDGGRVRGTEIAARLLLDHVIGTREPACRTATDIVIIGEYNVAGELDHIRPLLAALGIRLLASVPGDGRFAEIAAAHRARLILALCSQAMGHLAEELGARYAIPVLEGNFYGRAATAATLRAMAHRLAESGGPADLPDRAEALIGRCQAESEIRLAPYRAILTGKRAVLVAGGAKSWGLAAALGEAGLEVVASSAHKCSARDRRQIGRTLGLDDPPALDLGRLLAEGRADVVLSGGAAQFTVLSAGIPWVEVTHQRHMALSGYDGVVALAREVHTALVNPVWAQLRPPAPWNLEGARS